MLTTKQRQLLSRIYQLRGITYEDAAGLSEIIKEAEAILDDRQHQLRIAETIGQIKAVYQTRDGLECATQEVPFKEGRPHMRIHRYLRADPSDCISVASLKRKVSSARAYSFFGYRFDANHRPIAIYREEER